MRERRYRCDHSQEFVEWPEADAFWRLVPVLGEAKEPGSETMEREYKGWRIKVNSDLSEAGKWRPAIRVWTRTGGSVNEQELVTPTHRLFDTEQQSDEYGYENASAWIAGQRSGGPKTESISSPTRMGAGAARGRGALGDPARWPRPQLSRWHSSASGSAQERRTFASMTCAEPSAARWPRAVTGCR